MAVNALITSAPKSSTSMVLSTSDLKILALYDERYLYHLRYHFNVYKVHKTRLHFVKTVQKAEFYIKKVDNGEWYYQRRRKVCWNNQWDNAILSRMKMVKRCKMLITK